MSVIEMYCGGLGNGKSAIANQKAFRFMKKGGVIATNYPLIDGWAAKYASRTCPKYYTEEQVLEKAKFYYDRAFRFGNIESCYQFSDEVQKLATGRQRKTREEWGLMLFDECKLYFNARDYHDKTNTAYIEFFINLRKLKIRAIMMTHSDEDIDKQIRTTADITIWCRNLQRRKILGFSFEKFYSKPKFQTVTIVNTKGAFKGDEEERRSYDLDLNTCDLYDTFQLFDKNGKQFGLSKHGVDPIEEFNKNKELLKREKFFSYRPSIYIDYYRSSRPVVT